MPTIITKHQKKIIGTIIGFLISFTVWAIFEWKDYRVFKASTEENMVELKVIAKETSFTLKQVEIKLGKIEEALKRRTKKVK